MLVKIEARILIGTDFHFPSTSVPPGTFFGSGFYGKWVEHVYVGQLEYLSILFCAVFWAAAPGLVAVLPI